MFFLILILLVSYWFYNSIVNRRYLSRVYVDLKDQYEIVAFGDSLIEGIGAKHSYGFISRLEESLEIDIYNAGIRRMKTADALPLIQEQVLNFKPKLVIMSLGANDTLQRIPKSTTRTNLFKIINILTAQNIHVVVLEVEGISLNSKAQSIYEEMEKYYEKQVTIVHDFYKPILLKPKYLFDPLHPNDAGHDLLARNLEPIIRNILVELEREHN